MIGSMTIISTTAILIPDNEMWMNRNSFNEFLQEMRDSHHEELIVSDVLIQSPDKSFAVRCVDDLPIPDNVVHVSPYHYAELKAIGAVA
jgi:hypothetical protein